MLRHKRTHGQALVEFALAATLIFFLLAAAVDVGLIFFTLQGMHNAAQEGASYGSRWAVQFDASNNIVLNTNEIIDRVRGESGAKGGNGFINLYDLDANGVDDRTQNGYAEPNITTEFLLDPTDDGDPVRDVATGAAENQLCTDPSTTTKTCYIRVTVRSVHKMLFPFAPAFAKNVPLKSAFIMPLRSSLARGSGAPPSVPKNCTVPDFVGKKKNTTDSLWAGADFTGSLTFIGSGGNTSLIGGQDLPGGTVVPCTTSMKIWN
jgi:Flp pilus assembly protein TadG